tara:strand:- start:100 stop:351 length:252 start_codon:yes stop_codon:yes gene_type:complete
MNKILGYIISAIGLIALALTFDPIKSALNIPLPAQLNTTMLTIIAIVLLAIGIFLIIKGSKASQKHKEVPIYKGKKIIGYRQT